MQREKERKKQIYKNRKQTNNFLPAVKIQKIQAKERKRMKEKPRGKMRFSPSLRCSIHLLRSCYFSFKDIFLFSFISLPGCGRHVQQGFKPRGFGEIVRHFMPRVG
jgi:hypothetical protein